MGWALTVVAHGLGQLAAGVHALGRHCGRHGLDRAVVAPASMAAGLTPWLRYMSPAAELPEVGAEGLAATVDAEVAAGHSVVVVVASLAELGPSAAALAVGETVIPLHTLLPLSGVSIGMEMGCHQNDSLADG